MTLSYLLFELGIVTALTAGWAIWSFLTHSHRRQLVRQPSYARRAARPRRPNQA